jgi:hypothetical protein
VYNERGREERGRGKRRGIDATHEGSNGERREEKRKRM